MSANNAQMTRREALVRRIEASQSLTVAREQLQAWHALVTSMGAVVRLNMVSNPETTRFFAPILTRAINQERAWQLAATNLAGEVTLLSEKLRADDQLMTWREMRDEAPESDGI